MARSAFLLQRRQGSTRCQLRGAPPFVWGLRRHPFSHPLLAFRASPRVEARSEERLAPRPSAPRSVRLVSGHIESFAARIATYDQAAPPARASSPHRTATWLRSLDGRPSSFPSSIVLAQAGPLWGKRDKSRISQSSGLNVESRSKISRTYRLVARPRSVRASRMRRP
jgi:hypothetical protein